MSLWTCIACSARRAVGLETCPQCGAAAHEEGDTISPAVGVEGQPHVPAPYADAVPAPVVPAQTAPGATLTVIPEVPAPAPDAPAGPAAAPAPAADAPKE